MINRLYSLLISTFLILTSCSNDLEVVTPGKEIPVIHFIFNPTDSVYKLSLTKSFIFKGKISDSIGSANCNYTDTASIRLEGWQKEYKVWESGFHLDPTIKNPGSFPVGPGAVYLCDKVLGGEFDEEGPYKIDFFRIVVTPPGDTLSSFASISVFDPPKMTHPSPFDKTINLYRDSAFYFGIHVEFHPQLIWYGDVLCTIHYKEYTYTDQWITKRTDFNLKKNFAVTGENITLLIYPDMLFPKIARAIPENQEVYSRTFLSMEFDVRMADRNFRDFNDSYINLSDRDISNWGNFTNAMGIFCMVRSMHLTGFTFDFNTLDSLCSGQYTKKLNFKSWD